MAQGGNERSTEAGERFAGYQVYDRHYEKVGKVDDLFVDENDVPEYIGVKTGLFGGPSTLIPMDIVRVNDVRQLVEVAADRETIKNAPSFGDDAEITAGFEDRVYSHYGVTREVSRQDRGGYGAYYDEGSGVDLAYGERTDDRMSGVTMRSTAEDRGYIPTGAGEGSRVDAGYDKRADARAFGGPETHEGHGFLRREEEVDATDPARRKAWELGIDLTRVVGTGSGGRILVSDVTEHADRYPASPTDSEPARVGEGRGYARAEPAEEPRVRGFVYDQDIGAGYQETGTGEVGPGMRMGDTESGVFRGHASDDEGVGQRQGSDLEDEDELRVQRSEEELTAHTRERKAGSVNVRKRVRTDRERLIIPTRREEISVERVPMSGEATEAQIGDQEVTVPVVEDEVVVQKRPVVKEEIRVRKDVVEEQQIVEEDVRREEVEVEDATRRRGE